MAAPEIFEKKSYVPKADTPPVKPQPRVFEEDEPTPEIFSLRPRKKSIRKAEAVKPSRPTSIDKKRLPSQEDLRVRFDASSKAESKRRSAPLSREEYARMLGSGVLQEQRGRLRPTVTRQIIHPPEIWRPFKLRLPKDRSRAKHFPLPDRAKALKLHARQDLTQREETAEKEGKRRRTKLTSSDVGGGYIRHFTAHDPEL